jgi:hypothetical protein
MQGNLQTWATRYRRLPGGVVSGLLIVLGMRAILGSNWRKTKQFTARPREVIYSNPGDLVFQLILKIYFGPCPFKASFGLFWITFLRLPMLLVHTSTWWIQSSTERLRHHVHVLLHQIGKSNVTPKVYASAVSQVSQPRGAKGKGAGEPASAVNLLVTCLEVLPEQVTGALGQSILDWEHASSHKDSYLALLSSYLLFSFLNDWQFGKCSQISRCSWLKKPNQLSQRTETSLRSSESLQWKVAHWLMIFLDIVIANDFHSQDAHTIMLLVMRMTY